LLQFQIKGYLLIVPGGARHAATKILYTGILMLFQ
jgi:hypothetical protein